MVMNIDGYGCWLIESTRNILGQWIQRFSPVQADKELREMNEQMIAEKDMKLRHMKSGDRKRPVAVSETTFMIF